MANGEGKLTIFKLDASEDAAVKGNADVQVAVVVAAGSEARARQIAADNKGAEGVYPWAFTAASYVVGTAGRDVMEGVVLRDHRAG